MLKWMILLLIIVPVIGDMPDPYYKNVNWSDHSIYGLQLIVGNGFITPYQYGVFDCSNRASYLEWKLKNHGFMANICASENFNHEGYGHAWVKVNINNISYYIEPNEKGFNNMLINPTSDNYTKYCNYDIEYDNVYSAIKEEGIKEMDWWNTILIY